MRISVAASFVASVLLVCAFAFCVQAQDSTTIETLLDHVSAAEVILEAAQAQPHPSTAAGRRLRMQRIYEAQAMHARAEKEYYMFALSETDDLEAKAKISQFVWDSKRRETKYQTSAYSCMDSETFTVQYTSK